MAFFPIKLILEKEKIHSLSEQFTSPTTEPAVLCQPTH